MDINGHLKRPSKSLAFKVVGIYRLGWSPNPVRGVEVIGCRVPFFFSAFKEIENFRCKWAREMRELAVVINSSDGSLPDLRIFIALERLNCLQCGIAPSEVIFSLPLY